MTVGIGKRIAVSVFALIFFAALPSARAELAPDKIGIVLMHGKTGVPLGTANSSGGRLIRALRGAGYLVEAPEMCWSRYRKFDMTYQECFGDIDKAIAELKSQGAVAIVVAGLSLGGNATLGYGALHPELLGLIGFSPADDPVRKAKRPDIAPVIAHAEALLAQGKGDEKTEFDDVNTGPQGSYKMSLETTPRIYLSFWGPDAASGLADNAAKLKVPLLWVKGTKDPTQVNEPGYAYDKVPANPLNRFVEVTASHTETPDAGTDAVLDWLKAVAASK
jgi:pimeloyl-ACP methyl ester carboxylesterase